MCHALGSRISSKTAWGKASVFIRLLPSEFRIDELMYSCTFWDLSSATLGIVTDPSGRICLGSYWSWDRSETMVAHYLGWFTP